MINVKDSHLGLNLVEDLHHAYYAWTLIKIDPLAIQYATLSRQTTSDGLFPELFNASSVVRDQMIVSSSDTSGGFGALEAQLLLL